MSITLMAAAWRCKVNATDKIVMLALADHANDDGYCWPGNTSLQQKCGLSERAVRTSMQALESAGHMTRHYNTGKSTTYHIHPGTKCPRQDMPPAPRAATPAPRAPKSSRTIIANKATPYQRRAAEPKPILPDGVSPELWDDFKAMRKAKRAAMTPKAESLLIAKLGRLAGEGHPPAAVLEQSIMHNWTGIFEIKDQRNGKRHGQSEPMGHGNFPDVGESGHAGIDAAARIIGRLRKAHASECVD